MEIDKLLSGKLRRLRHTLRYGSHPVIKHENVAEHSYFTALYAMIIADDLVKNHKAQIDFAKLLGNALVHDIEENGTGDLLRSTKHYNHEITSAMKKVEDEVAKGISQDITGGPLLYNRWKTAKDPKTLEGQIVALADILTVVAYTLEELSMGNQSMRSVLNEVYNTLQDIIEGGDKTITNKQVMKYVMDTAVVLDLYRNLKETNL